MTKDPTPMSDDFDLDLIEEPAKHYDAQIADALIGLSKAVDICREPKAKEILLKAMDCLVLRIDVKRGELKAIKK